MIIIRQATNNDIPYLLPLIEQLGYPQDLKNLQERFQQFMKQEGYGVAVAANEDKIEDKIVGWVAWSKSCLFVEIKTRIHIEGLVVDKKYQGQGIGKMLMKFVEDVAIDHSPCIIDLVSGVRRAKDGTHDFYKRLGYHNEGHMAKLYLRKEL